MNVVSTQNLMARSYFQMFPRVAWFALGVRMNDDPPMYAEVTKRKLAPIRLQDNMIYAPALTFDVPAGQFEALSMSATPAGEPLDWGPIPITVMVAPGQLIVTPSWVMK